MSPFVLNMLRKYYESVQMKATEQNFPVVIFKAVLPFESVDEILRWKLSNESHRAVLSCCTFKLFLVALTFDLVGEILEMV